MSEAAWSQVKHKKLSKGRLIQRFMAIVLGAVIMAIGLEVFLIPNSVIDGGVTGISIMLSHITHLPLGIFILITNLPFFFFGYKQIGKTFAISSLIGIVVLSVFTSLLQPVRAFTDDILLATIFGGMVIGVGVGLVIRFGGVLDGTETLAIVISNKTPFSVGEIIMTINVFILGVAGFVFSWDRSMYSILAYVIATKTIDMVVQGLDDSKSVWIISDEHQKIGDAIIARLGRGVTYLKGEGAYTEDEKKVVFCIINRLEEAKLKSIVENTDPKAFVAIGDIAEVRGGNFKKKSIH